MPLLLSLILMIQIYVIVFSLWKRLFDVKKKWLIDWQLCWLSQPSASFVTRLAELKRTEKVTYISVIELSITMSVSFKSSQEFVLQDLQMPRLCRRQSGGILALHGSGRRRRCSDCANSVTVAVWKERIVSEHSVWSYHWETFSLA